MTISVLAANDTGSTAVAAVWLTMSAICLVAVYWIPVIVAWRRKLANRSQILVITLLTGWTFFGWVVALVMALKPAERPVLPQYYPQPGPWR